MVFLDFEFFFLILDASMLLDERLLLKTEFNFILYVYVHVYIRVFVFAICVCMPEEARRGAGVPGGCESPDMGAGN